MNKFFKTKIFLNDEPVISIPNLETLKEEETPIIPTIIADKDKSKKKFLVIDTGIGLDHALQLGKDSTVYYYTNWQTPYPTIEASILGYGFDEIQKIEDYGKILLEKSIDAIIFTDVGFGSLADYFRAQGYSVWGTSELAEKLEQDRIFMINTFKELGIGVPATYICKGIKELLKFLSNNEGKTYFIKINKFRGNVETFSVNSASQAELLLMQSDMGKILEIADFVVQEPCPGVEIGIDAFFNGKEFIKPYFVTLEKHATVGKWEEKSFWDDLWLNKIKDWLAETGYRGNISLEAFYDNGKIYALDTTCRFPYPNSCLFPRTIKNWSDAVLEISKGNYPKLEITSSYSAEIPIFSDAAHKSIKDIQKELIFNLDEKEIDKYFAIRNMIKLDGKLYHISLDEMLTFAIGYGNTANEAIGNAQKMTEKFSTVKYLVSDLKELNDLLAKVNL